MTPTLAGRIETRIFINAIIAFPILATLGFPEVFFIMLAIGVAMDFAYNFLQLKRWDGDWPLVFVIISGLVEGVILWAALSLIIRLDLKTYLSMYGIIWLLMFILQASFLHALFPYRRFRGGRIL